MDLLNFSDEALYFDEPVSPEVETLERLETLAAIDTSDRLGIQDLRQLAQSAIAGAVYGLSDD